MSTTTRAPAFRAPRRPAGSSQAGFTLVELSIVLVIIGLIIGGVLTGQQVLQNARITNAVNALQGYQAAAATYNQNFNATVGDDNAAATRFPGTPAITNGNGNGTIQGAFDSTTNTDESRIIWTHLRVAGLIRGSRGQFTQPGNPFGGIYGIEDGAFTGGGAITGTVLCLNNVPGSIANVIDSRLDDGIGTSGLVRGANTIAAGTEAYAPTETYVVCTNL